ncbi:MAG: hypothetical protein HONDAALG_02088 [Gammaproteobacteria bacterium]|nr:hypothetical protein [Gammaproteobacteria bacterium]
MVKRLTLKFLNVLWKTTAVLVVGVAVMVSVVRLMLPGIDRYREPITQWVSRQIAQPVEFDAITANWRGWTPVIELSNVRLTGADGGTSVTRFAKARFALDPIRSLKRREIVPGQLVVSGMQISLARSEGGSIRLEGVGEGEAAVSSLRKNALAYWLQTQRQLTIEEAAITWNDDRLLKPLIFSNVSLDIRSDGQRRQFNGRARLPDSESEFEFRLDADGDLLTSTWSGTMYLEGHGIDPQSLLEYKRWLGLEVVGGRLDFRFWSDWKNARVTRVSGVFSAGGSEVGARGHRILLQQMRGNVDALRTEAGQWLLRVDSLQVGTANGSWPDNRIVMQLKRARAPATTPEMQINVAYLKLDDLVPVASSITALPPQVRDALTSMGPHGAVRDLRVRYTPTAAPGEQTALSAEFEDLGIRGADLRPGLDGLRGSIAVAADSGTLTLDCDRVTVSAPKLYDQPIILTRLDGRLGLSRTGDGWRLSTDGLGIANADFDLTAFGNIAARAGAAPNAQLFARIDHLSARRIKDYLPTVGLTPKVRDWFGHAFPSGRVDGGGIVVRGPLDQFPFDGRNGRFEARLHVVDAELLFRPKWPVITRLSGDVVFAGRSMTVLVPQAETIGAELTETTARIPDLFAKEKLLLIDGTARGPTAVGRKYLLESPLKDKVPDVPDLLTDAGRIDLALSLRIPLRPVPNEIKGTVRLHDAVVRSRQLNGEIKSVSGTLTFTQKGFEATGLQGFYADRPVELSITGTSEKGRVDAQFTLGGRGDTAYLADRLRAFTPGIAGWLERHKALEHAVGETDWQVTAQLSRAAGGAARVTDLRVTSTLAGMQLALPSPLGKDRAESRPLAIHVDLAQPTSRGIDFSLGNELHGALLLTEDVEGDTSLKRAALRFGNSPASLPSDDTLSITGTTSELSINDWLDALYERMSLGGAVGNSSAPPIPIWIDLSAGRLQALGRNFEHVRVRGDSGRTHWKLHVVGDQIEGDVIIPHYLRQMPSKAHLRKLHVPPRAVASVTPVDVNPGRMPPFSITIDDFAYQTVSLGRGELRTSPVANGLKIETLTFESPASKISAEGEWIYADEVHTSRFSIDVNAADLGKLLGQFGYGVTAVEGGKTAIDINASWAGSPADFTLERLHGSMTMNIEDGRFLDVDNPAVGRLFGLLSIQALPKRLMLDFNDLFAKGMSFDRISGNFEFDGGNAYTNNLVMNASSARIEVTGRTGLAGQDYDQVATVTPQISDSLPVASAIFGPVGATVGAAIFIGKQLIPELPGQIDKLLAKQYTITGSWKDPKVEQVHGNSGENVSPAPTADG